MTSTTTWNKLGDPINKQERKLPGIYIMANDGKIENFQEADLKSMKVIEGDKYSKISVTSKIANFTITVDHKEVNIINVPFYLIEKESINLRQDVEKTKAKFE